MKTHINHLWGKVVASYWFTPTVMSVLAVAGASAALRFDRGGSAISDHRWLAWASVNTADGARDLLSTIASSTITVAGVIFSITIVALSFASSQYGPRLLRNFMRDRPSQVVLGAFLSTYLYCLVVLRTIGGNSDGQLPHVALAGALGLGIASMAVLIFFIHHLARAIQVSSIVDAVGWDLAELIRDFERSADAAPSPPPSSAAASPQRARQAVESRSTGYVQALALEDLVEGAAAVDGFVTLHIAPGDYVSRRQPLATFASAGERIADREIDRVRSAVVIGITRTNEQDLEFPIDQLAEIAVRALSPGLNDPFTAILCINRLGAELGALARCRWPGPVLRDGQGRERVQLLPMSMERLLHRAFGQILHFGGSNPAIARQVMKMLAQTANGSTEPHLPALRAFADRTMRRWGGEAPAELREWHERIVQSANAGAALDQPR